MKQGLRKKIKNERGITLVETLLSAVILVLILSIFLAVFNQSANQNRTSKAVIDATYLAQMQLENVYSKSLSFKNYEAAFADLGYTYTYEANDWVHFLHTGHDSYPEFYTEIKIKNKQDDDLYHVVVMVYQKSDDSLQAMMQNIVLWEQSEP